jgi:hypothetical protein
MPLEIKLDKQGDFLTDYMQFLNVFEMLWLA